jgi:hypothetical protein
MKQNSNSTNWEAIEKGSEVRIVGVPGAFQFMSTNIERDGQRVVTVWGGDRKPTGIRMFRTFYADRVRPYSPRVDHKKMVASALIAPTNRKGKR